MESGWVGIFIGVPTLTKYNAAVEGKLNGMLLANPTISAQDAAKAVQGYADQLRAGITRTENKIK